MIKFLKNLKKKILLAWKIWKFRRTTDRFLKAMKEYQKESQDFLNFLKEHQIPYEIEEQKIPEDKKKEIRYIG